VKHASRRGIGSAFKTRTYRRKTDGQLVTYRYPKERYDQQLKKAREARAQASAPYFGLLVEKYRAADNRYRKPLKTGKPVKATTKYSHDRILERLDEEFGWMTREDLEAEAARQDFIEFRSQYQDRPAMRHALMTMLYKLLRWSQRAGYLAINQMEWLEPMPPKKRPRKNKRWTPAYEAVIVEHCPKHVSRPFRFMRMSAVRPVDWVTFTNEDHIDDEGWLVFTPIKTEDWGDGEPREVHIPIFAFPPLAELFEELPKKGHLFQHNGAGSSVARGRRGRGGPWARTPYGTTSYSKVFPGYKRDAFEEAGIEDPDLILNDTRRSFITELLDAKCTDAEVEAVTGHAWGRDHETERDKKRSALGNYIDHTRKMALSAYTKLWAYRQQPPEPKVVPFKKRSA
jgi:hypothetical protein